MYLISFTTFRCFFWIQRHRFRALVPLVCCSTPKGTVSSVSSSLTQLTGIGGPRGSERRNGVPSSSSPEAHQLGGVNASVIPSSSWSVTVTGTATVVIDSPGTVPRISEGASSCPIVVVSMSDSVGMFVVVSSPII